VTLTVDDDDSSSSSMSKAVVVLDIEKAFDTIWQQAVTIRYVVPKYLMFSTFPKDLFSPYCYSILHFGQ